MSHHPESAPTRVLPANPNLEQLRKQAKDLLKQFLADEPAAVAEVERFERSPDQGRFALADAQRVLARAYGFASWAKLKLHVDGTNIHAFSAAVNAGDVATVRSLAKARPDLVELSPDGEFGERMPLHLAVLRRDAAMTRVLLELGSDARAGIWPHRDATTAHAIAKDRGYDDILAILEHEEQRRRTEMSTPGATIGSQTDQILQAIATGLADGARRMLEADPALIGACNVRGATPLHIAAWSQQPELIRWLTERHAVVDARDAEGHTPLDYAALVAGWSAHGRHTVFMEHSDKPPAVLDETVRLLRSAGAELTARAAVALGDEPTLRQLHQQGRLKNEIHWLRGGLLSIAVRVNRLDTLKLLLGFGLDPDETVLGEEGSKASWGMPLWFAALCDRTEAAELLLTRGADVNGVVYASGDAMSMAQGEQMPELLLRHGARLTVETLSDRGTAQGVLKGTIPASSLDIENPTPTQLAEQMLLAAGNGDPEIVRMCLPHMTRDRTDPWWNYVLIRAGVTECFRLILSHGVDPDAGDVSGKGGFTMLHHVATESIDAETRVLRATLLLDAGASLSRRDPMLKSTPLGWACRWGRAELVKLYLERGVDPQERDAEPWATPMARAEKGGHHEIVELLKTAISRD